MKQLLQLSIFSVFMLFSTTSLVAQNNGAASAKIDFSDRQAVHEAVNNFFIGDQTGSIEHKKLSMDPKGAYRYVNREGEYSEGIFDLESNDADPSYKEELLSVEIYGTLALARLRLVPHDGNNTHYKLLTLHKTKNGWKVTSISWGFGIKP